MATLPDIETCRENIFLKGVEVLSRWAFSAAALCVFAMIVPVVIDVLSRFIFHRSIAGAIEIEELLLLCVVFLSLAKPQLDGTHISVDLLFMHCGEKVQRTLMTMNWICASALSLFMVIYAFRGTVTKYHSYEYTADLFISIWPFYLLAACSLVVLGLAILATLFIELRKLITARLYGNLLIALCLSVLILTLPWTLQGTVIAKDFGIAGGFCIVLLMTLILLRMPIAMAMSLVGVLGLMIINQNPMNGLRILSSVPNSALNYNYTVVPMFILIGEFVLFARIGEQLFATCSVWLGRFPGGLAMSSVAGCAGFAAICGESLPTAMTMTSVALPEMKKRNYHEGLSCACLAAGGTLGILIPPSVGFIFYAIVTEVSIGQLFLAGLIPGFLLLVMFCLIIYVFATRYPHLAPRGEGSTWKEKFTSLWGIFPMLALIVLMLGGILSGIFSPTEGGAVGAAGTMVYAICKKRLGFKEFWLSINSAAGLATKVMFILIGVNILGAFLATTQLPFRISDLVMSMDANRYVVFAFVVVMYLVLGCLFNVIPMILLTLPAIFPTILSLGFDPVWFGVVIVILMEMGQITPPVGIVVFAIAGMPGGAPMGQIFKYVVPFVCTMLLCVLLLTIFPQIALFLPNLLITGN